MRDVRLTRRGERLLGAAYTALIITVSAALLLALIGLAGWIETLP